MTTYINDHKAEFGIEPICRTLGLASSTYYAAKNRAPSKRSINDVRLMPEICRVFKQNYQVYGRRKLWRQLNREGIKIGRDQTVRLMKQAGIAGVMRGREVRTTKPDYQASRPPDLVDRDFNADRPNRVWVTDFTSVRAWKHMCM